MEIVGFVLAIGIGVLLGLIGGGGSILAIPVLVYVVHIPPSHATTYSLFIVGIVALIGSIKRAKDALLDYKIALYFGLPSVVAICAMRQWVMPMLPSTFFYLQGVEISKDFLIMFVFGVLMIVASYAMIKKSGTMIVTTHTIDTYNLAVKGIVVGLISGFVGVGGGFLIIPTLIFSAHLSMKKAVATSLVIIACNALIGFVASLHNSPIEWIFLWTFAGFTVIGMMIGMYFGSRIAHEKLKTMFGWFVLLIGIYIVIKELILK